jgi:hypothetical protein
MTDDVKVSKVKLASLVPDEKNANKGTIRGQKALEDSIQTFGFVEAGTLDKNNRIIGGNKRTEAVAAIGLSDDVIIIDVDGRKPVYLRTPYDLDTPEGRKLAYALNRIHELSYDVDPLQLAADLDSGLDLSSLWTDEELVPILEAAGSELDNPPDVDFKEYDESVENDVEYITCPHCGKQFPK